MSTLLEGRVMRAYNGYYYVDSSLQELVTCKLRGKIKQKRFSLLVGDQVQFSLEADKSGIIHNILPRLNALTRPAVANVQQVILVVALREPQYNFILLDKLLALYAKVKTEVVLCFNKSDLITVQEKAKLYQLYNQIGYKIIFTSTYTEDGIEELKECLKDKVTVFAGPSGVGKSSLLNKLQSGLNLDTGEVSIKIKRGKHTTRFAQLIKLSFGGYLADTPGFSNVESEVFAGENLSELFYDIKELSKACRFTGCRHDREPDCAVKAAVGKELAVSRYESYMNIMSDLQK